MAVTFTGSQDPTHCNSKGSWDPQVTDAKRKNALQHSLKSLSLSVCNQLDLFYERHSCVCLNSSRDSMLHNCLFKSAKLDVKISIQFRHSRIWLNTFACQDACTANITLILLKRKYICSKPFVFRVIFHRNGHVQWHIWSSPVVSVWRQVEMHHLPLKLPSSLIQVIWIAFIKKMFFSLRGKHSADYHRTSCLPVVIVRETACASPYWISKFCASPYRIS